MFTNEHWRKLARRQDHDSHIEGTLGMSVHESGSGDKSVVLGRLMRVMFHKEPTTSSR